MGAPSSRCATAATAPLVHPSQALSPGQTVTNSQTNQVGCNRYQRASRRDGHEPDNPLRGGQDWSGATQARMTLATSFTVLVPKPSEV